MFPAIFEICIPKTHFVQMFMLLSGKAHLSQNMSHIRPTIVLSSGFFLGCVFFKLVLKYGLAHLNANARDKSNANANAQQLNQMQMQIGSNSNAFRSNAICKCYFITMFFAFSK